MPRWRQRPGRCRAPHRAGTACSRPRSPTPRGEQRRDGQVRPDDPRWCRRLCGSRVHMTRNGARDPVIPDRCPRPGRGLRTPSPPAAQPRCARRRARLGCSCSRAAPAAGASSRPRQPFEPVHAATGIAYGKGIGRLPHRARADRVVVVDDGGAELVVRAEQGQRRADQIAERRPRRELADARPRRGAPRDRDRPDLRGTRGRSTAPPPDRRCARERRRVTAASSPLRQSRRARQDSRLRRREEGHEMQVVHLAGERGAGLSERLLVGDEAAATAVAISRSRRSPRTYSTSTIGWSCRLRPAAGRVHAIPACSSRAGSPIPERCRIAGCRTCLPTGRPWRLRRSASRRRVRGWPASHPRRARDGRRARSSTSTADGPDRDTQRPCGSERRRGC